MAFCNAGLTHHQSQRLTSSSGGCSSDSTGSNLLETQPSQRLSTLISAPKTTSERRSSTDADVSETSRSGLDRTVAVKQENVESLIGSGSFVDSTTLLQPPSPSSQVSQTLSPMSQASQAKEEEESSPVAPSKPISFSVFLLHLPIFFFFSFFSIECIRT